MFNAEIVADSKNEWGQRLTTFVVVFPRIVLAEFNTHRMLSKNSASSRAISFIKMLEAVRSKPFKPLRWMKEHKGMQGNDFFTAADDPAQEVSILDSLEHTWLSARDSMMLHSAELNRLGLSKQICNRLLEPFMWHKVIVTGSDWENFFALRAEWAAEIHIQHLANLMLDVYNKSTPKQLVAGEWHIPFGDQIDEDQFNFVGPDDFTMQMQALEMFKVKIATARCAGVSYTVVGEDGKEEDYEKLIKRHDKLAGMGHWSPFEHCAKAMSKLEYDMSQRHEIVKYEGVATLYSTNGWSGNTQGFIQYRKMFENENRKDSRVVKK